MRIVGGALGGRRLVAPAGVATRPTSDRVREALFSALEARLGQGLGSASVLDAYAGSGALGLEALSRGAAYAVFVERETRALAAIKRNVAELDLAEKSRVLPGDVRRLAKRGMPEAPFSLLFLDPPYRIDRSEVRGVIDALISSGALTESALVVWEHASEDGPEWPPGVHPVSERRYGSTTVSIGQVEGVGTG